MGVTVKLDSFKHYQLVRTGEIVEIFEYGNRCPLMPYGGEYEGKTSISKIDIAVDVVWDWTGGEGQGGQISKSLQALEADGTIPHRISYGTIFCGDDFIGYIEGRYNNS